MYLWCANCYHTHLRLRWEVKGAKYGVCPNCGCSSYRNAEEWLTIAAANDYPEVPDQTKIYVPHPVLFNFEDKPIIK